MFFNISTSGILTLVKKETAQLKKLIQKSQNILILTHKGPDFDAFCSALILKEFLNTYYPKKNVVFKSRQMPTQNIPHMHEIAVVERIEREDEELIILTDASKLEICINHSDDIQSSNAKIVSIDHHDTVDIVADLSINFNMSSATEQVLNLCFEMEKWKFKITEDISKLGQIGIVSDTGRFLYENATPDTYEMFGKLRKVYALDLEDFTYKNSKFPLDTIEPLRIFLKNINTEDDMAYTYISKKDIDELELSKTGVNNAQQHVRDRVLRHLHGIHWGFVIKPSYYKENIWQVSFRSTKGYQKVSEIALLLGGGGHEYSSAARVEASDVEKALEIVLTTIHQYLSDHPSS